ncbi:hypothetical protein [Lederbergia citrea]|uniref:hypothetical protein n=1 Tax=Lederbergia citrea TaxID=2833581 RepID=UPI001BC8DFE8|nr:hypothetical protein [Lederbergia citrea]MBS4205042.1 hypothetical protein [Lederbergia citrea]
MFNDYVISKLVEQKQKDLERVSKHYWKIAPLFNQKNSLQKVSTKEINALDLCCCC